MVSIVVRAMLLSGSALVSEWPPQTQAMRSRHDSGVLGAERLLHQARPDAPHGAILGDLLEEIDVRVEEERQPRRERVDVDARDRGTP